MYMKLRRLVASDESDAGPRWHASQRHRGSRHQTGVRRNPRLGTRFLNIRRLGPAAFIRSASRGDQG